MKKITSKTAAILLSILLCLQQIGLAQIAEQLDISGRLSGLHTLANPDTFRPLHLRYLSYNNLDNKFSIFLDKGSIKDPEKEEIDSASRELLRYFLIGLSLPNDSFWVNLRPDSPENIIDPLLAQTDVGRIMLEADLQLKKDTAGATSPETSEGRQYWDKLYQKAGQLFGSENITIPTLTRPWIVPDEIIIGEGLDSAYIYKATFKVCLEQDYLKDTIVPGTGDLSAYNFKDPRLKELNEYSTQLIREMIIPNLIKEVNTSKKYAALRQVYYSLILASWFKARNRNKNNPYSGLIDKKSLAGVTSLQPWSKDTYFQSYRENFQKGEYKLQETAYTPYGQTIRSYFSGGISGVMPAMPGFGESTTAGVTTIASLPVSSPVASFKIKNRSLIPLLAVVAITVQGIALPTILTAQEAPAAAVNSLGEFNNPKEADALAKLSEDPNPGVRNSALYTLAELNDPRAIKPLCKLLNSQDEDGRNNTIYFLEKINTPAAVEPLLEEMLDKSNSVITQRIAAVMLGKNSFGLSDDHKYKKLFTCFFDRADDIMAGGFSPYNIFLVYGDQEFLRQTNDLHYANQFSLARGIEAVLSRFNKEINNKNIGIALPYLVDSWRSQAQRPLINKDSRTISCVHKTFEADGKNLAEFMRLQFGVNTDDAKAFFSFVGTNNIDELRETKQALRQRIEDPQYNLLVFNTHGDTGHLWFNDKVPGVEESEYDGLTYNELADNLLNRARHNQGRLSDLTIIIDACFSADFPVNAMNRLAYLFSQGQIKDFPTIITSTQKGMKSYGVSILDNLKEVAGGKKELRLSDFYDVAAMEWDRQEMGFFLPLTVDNLEKLKDDLGVTGNRDVPLAPLGLPAEGQELHPDIPAIIAQQSTGMIPVSVSSPVKRNFLISVVFAGGFALGGIFMPGAQISAQEIPQGDAVVITDPISDLINKAQDQLATFSDRWDALDQLGGSHDVRAVEPIVNIALYDPNIEIRKIAVKALGEFTDIRVVPVLVNLVSDQNESIDVRQAAILALVKLNDPLAVEPLGKLLIDRNENKVIRRFAAYALGKLNDPGSISLLSDVALHDPETDVKREAIYSLGKFRGPEVRNVLIYLSQPGQDNDVRLAAIYALGASNDPEVLDIITAFLANPALDIRIAALGALSDFTDPRILDRLIDVALHDPDENIRLEAAVACLKNFDDSRAVDVLIDIFQQTAYAPMRHYAAQVLSNSKNQAAIDKLIDIALHYPRPYVSKDAAIHLEATSALRNINSQKVIDPLIKLSSDPDSKVRYAAISGLARYNDPRVIQALIDRLFDTDKDVHQDAASTLRGMNAQGAVETLVKMLLSETNIIKARLIAVSLGEIGGKVLPEEYPYKRLIDCFSDRKTDINAGGFSPLRLLLIYGNQEFRQKTDAMHYGNQFGLARGIESVLVRFNREVNDENIRKVIPFILDSWNTQGQRVVMGKGSRVIAGFHQEPRFDQQGFAEFMRDQFGINTDDPNTFTSFKGSQNYDELVKAKQGLRKKIEDPNFNLLYFDNHGSTLDVWLTFGPVMRLGSGRSYDSDAMTLSYKELNQDLLKRARNNGGNLSDLTIMVGACYSADFIVNTYNELVRAYLSGQVKSLPLVITATARGTVGYQIFDKIKEVAQGKSELRLSDFYNIATLVWDSEEMTFFLPLSRESLKGLKEVLGIDKAIVPTTETGITVPGGIFRYPELIMPIGEPYEGQITPINPNVPALIVRTEDTKIPDGRASSPINANPPDKQPGLGVSSPIGRQNNVGGIDFRSLPIVTRAIGSLSADISSIPLAQLNSVDLSLEWQGIQEMLDAGIAPSTERIREYVQASCFKGEINNDIEKVVYCIADILRLEEERCSATEPILRDMLVALGSGMSAQELRQAFIGKI